jgi:hypothetical protein
VELEPKPWLKQTSKEYQSDPFLNQFNNLNELSRYVLNTKNAVTVPGEEATDQEIAEYKKALNIPDTPEGYKIDIPEDSVLAEAKDFVRTLGAKLELSQQQMDVFVEIYKEYAQESLDKALMKRTENYVSLEKELKKKYGQDYPSKVYQLALANKQLLMPDFINLMKTAGLDNHPIIAEHLIKVGETLAEHGVKGIHSMEGPPKEEGHVMSYGDAFKKFASPPG